MATHKVYVENLGCAKNQVDAEVMISSLKEDGYINVETADEATIIIVNTCGFIESAREESIDTFFALKNSYPDKKILFTGCLAQRYAKELDTDLVEADAIFGNRDLKEINKVVKRVENGERVVVTPSYPDIESEYDQRGKLFNYPGSAYLKISEGCNHRCRYCAIPLIRGSLRSRPEASIYEDVKHLVASNVKEINIIAQDLAAYGTDREGGTSAFLPLLENIALIEGDFSIRLLYIHPDAFPLELLDLMKKYPKIIPYFDIPFQHADSRVLSRMGRVGDKESYLELIAKIRGVFPQATIRSTFMLGFTNEDEQTFQTLLDFIQEAQLDYAGTFIFSVEEGTPAFDDSDQKSYEKRIKMAQGFKKSVENLCESITISRLQQYVGSEMDILIEELVENEDLAIGRTLYQAPEVDGLTVVMGRNLVAGSIVRCGITKVNGVDLEAVVIEQ
jgi:ribosomal protein S12 methylthiotransferase